MRTYQIVVNGKEYTVSIDDPNATPAAVEVNGQVFQVTIDEQRRAGPTASVETDVEATFAPIVTPTFVNVETEPEPDTKPSKAPASGAGPDQIIAPMPGKILDILVKVGDRVERGETLCNLEAMKMKSPIRSTAEGTIAEVLASEGQNVSHGDVLFTLS